MIRKIFENHQSDPVLMWRQVDVATCK